MTLEKTTTFASAAELPAEWDALARGNVFLERKQLSVLERVNPCGQQYFMVGVDSIITTYRHKLNLLAFAPGRLNVPVTMIGVPCSVSAPGFSIGDATRQQAAELITGITGLKLVLNTPSNCALDGLVKGRTLPSCELEVRWRTFEAYLASLRSHYRYEMCKTMRMGEKISAAPLTENAAHDDELHHLYLNVYNRSDYKLECLAPEFFREFPGDIYVFKLGSRPVGFVKALESGGRLIFLFGGVDYGCNDEFRVYLNMLLFLVKEGIRRHVQVVDFGQTAEDAKLKLGCRYSGRNVYAGHSNAVMQCLLKSFAGFLSYEPPEENYHVFKA